MVGGESKREGRRAYPDPVEVGVQVIILRVRSRAEILKRGKGILKHLEEDCMTAHSQRDPTCSSEIDYNLSGTCIKAPGFCKESLGD